MRANRVLAGLYPLLAATALAVETREVPSRIEAVTIHPMGAEIRRVARGVHLAAGDNPVSFVALPATVNTGSLRASGSGNAEVRVVNIEIREDRTQEVGVVDPADKEAVDRAQAEVDRLEARRHSLDAASRFLTGLSEWRPDRVDDLKPAALGFLVAFISEGSARNESDRLALSHDLDVAKRELTQAQQKLERRQAERPPPRLTATVELQSPSVATADLVLEYAVDAASWRPAYDVSVGADFDTLEVASEAVIQQTTGEDWKGVAVVLSTMALEHGLPTTQLAAWRISLPETPSGDRATSMRVIDLGQNVFVRGGRSTEVATELGGLAPPAIEEAAPPPTEIGRVEAQPSTSAFASDYRIPGRHDLASDGVQRRFPVGTTKLAARIRDECAPAISPKVALVANAVNSLDTPLLAGEARMRIDGQFSGHGFMPEVAPGQELSLALGVDPRVQVERKLVRQQDAPEGSRSRMHHAVRVEVRSSRRSEVRVLIRERVPLGENKEIDVKVRKVVPEVSPDEDGILEWDLEVPPSGTSRVELAYEVRYPTDRKPHGL